MPPRLHYNAGSYFHHRGTFVARFAQFMTAGSRYGSALLDSALFLLAAGTLADITFDASQAFGDLLGILLVAVLVWRTVARVGDRAAPDAVSRARRVLSAALAGVALLAVLGIRTFEGAAQVAVLATVLVALEGALAFAGRRADGVLRAQQLAAILIAVATAAFAYNAYASRALEAAAGSYSRLASAFVAGDVRLGSGTLGLQLLIAVMLYAVAMAAVVRTRLAASNAAVSTGALVVLPVAYGALVGGLASVSAVQHGVGLYQPLLASHDYRIVLLTIAAAIVALGVDAPEDAPEDAPATDRAQTRRMTTLAIATGVLFALSAAALALPSLSFSDAKHSVVILDTLGPGGLAKDIPTFERLGLGEVGQFGLLPTYLESSGYEVTVVDEITTESLGDAGTLVILNLRETLSDDGSQAVWDFVADGGSLIIAGDHTATEQIREPSNALLERVGIALGFDSAIPFRSDWLDAFTMQPHPVFAGVAPVELGHVIGASLSVRPPARAVLLGRGGFVDAGDLENAAEGFLGDMHFNRGERVGDIPLVAEAAYGRGKVLAFGDTTSFQNPALAKTYRYVDNVFAWTSSRGDASLSQRLGWLAAAMLLAGTILLVAWAWRPLLVPAAAVGLVVGLALGAVAPALWQPRQPEPSPTARWAVVDASHFEVARLDKSGQALDGLIVNLIRNGYVPRVMRDFESEMVASASLLVVPTPSVPFTAGERDALDGFVDGGGLLVVTAGADNPAGSSSLPAHLGFRVGKAPLGRGEAHWRDRTIDFWSAWPLETVDAAANTDAETIATVWDYPVAIYRPQGEGGVFVIADGSFVMNKNLEDVGDHNAENVMFWRDFLAEYGPVGGAGD